MIFPIGDDQVHGVQKAYFSYFILLLNILVFGYELSLNMEDLGQFTSDYGAVPAEMLHAQDLYSVVTSLFLHGGWAHILGNMLFLWVFADNIEATLGSIRFILFYLFGGIAATLFHALMFPASEIPLIGASGAISAVLGAYLVLYPKSRIRVLVIFLFTSFRVPALLFLGLWIVIQFFQGYGSLGAVTNEESGVAYWAHIGGFVFGLIVGFAARRQEIPQLVGHDEEHGYV